MVFFGREVGLIFRGSVGRSCERNTSFPIVQWSNKPDRISPACFLEWSLANKALRSKNSHKSEIIISTRVLFLLKLNFAISFSLHRIRFLPIFSTFGWSVLEIFYQSFFGFGKIGVPYREPQRQNLFTVLLPDV